METLGINVFRYEFEVKVVIYFVSMLCVLLHREFRVDISYLDEGGFFGNVSGIEKVVRVLNCHVWEKYNSIWSRGESCHFPRFSSLSGRIQSWYFIFRRRKIFWGRLGDRESLRKKFTRSELSCMIETPEVNILIWIRGENCHFPFSVLRASAPWIQSWYLIFRRTGIFRGRLRDRESGLCEVDASELVIRIRWNEKIIWNLMISMRELEFCGPGDQQNWPKIKNKYGNFCKSWICHVFQVADSESRVKHKKFE